MTFSFMRDGFHLIQCKSSPQFSRSKWAGCWADDDLAHVHVIRLFDGERDRPRDEAKKLPMDAPLVNTFLLLVRIALGCLLIPVGYRVARARDRLGQTVAFSLAYLLTLVVCQIARAHYFMIWFPVVMFAGLWLMRENHPRLAALYALTPGILVTAHYAFLHIVGAIGLLGLGTALWYFAVCLTVIWICPAETSESNIFLHTGADYSFCDLAIGEVNRKAA
jgi:hypothetical protein